MRIERTVNPYILLLRMSMDTNIMENSTIALKNLRMDPASPPLGIYLKKNKISVLETIVAVSVLL